jgi:hypothetical protein
MLAWSRILDGEEVLVLVNTHGELARGGRVEVDRRLAGDRMTVVCDTAHLGDAGRDPSGGGPDLGFAVLDGDGTSFLDVPPLGPSEVLVLANGYRGG